MSVIIKIIYLITIINYFYKTSFSEIYIKNLKLKHHIIVSLTTCKENIESFLIDNFIRSILNQTLRPYKILLSINKRDIVYFTDYLILLIKKKIVEII